MQICLSAKDGKESLEALPETTELLAKFFDVGNEQLAQITYQQFTRIIDCCVQDEEAASRVR